MYFVYCRSIVPGRTSHLDQTSIAMTPVSSRILHRSRHIGVAVGLLFDCYRCVCHNKASCWIQSNQVLDIYQEDLKNLSEVLHWNKVDRSPSKDVGRTAACGYRCHTTTKLTGSTKRNRQAEEEEEAVHYITSIGKQRNKKQPCRSNVA
jgi:hypothetical protein